MSFTPLASDGQPLFTEGLSRRQWLDATKDERKAAFLAELLSPADEDDWDFVAPTETPKVQTITPDELAKLVEDLGPHFSQAAQ